MAKKTEAIEVDSLDFLNSIKNEAIEVDSLDFLDTFKNNAIEVDSLDFLDAFKSIAPTRSEVEEPKPIEIVPPPGNIGTPKKVAPVVNPPEIATGNVEPVVPIGDAPVRAKTTIQKPETNILEQTITRGDAVAPVVNPPEIDTGNVEEIKIREAQKQKATRVGLPVLDNDVVSGVEEIRRKEARKEEKKATSVGLPVSDDDVVSEVEEIKIKEAQFETLKGELESPIRGAVGNELYYDHSTNTFSEKFGAINKNASSKEDYFTGAKGIFIPSELGSNVRSVADGTVTYVGFLRGYGNVVIVDHGQDFSTIYGNSESTTVKEGEQIKAGDQLGTVGNSGGMKESGTYFEIRREAEVVDPIGWFSPTVGAGEAAEKGIKTTIEQFKMTAPAIQLQAASNQIVNQRNLLSVFDRLDNGEQLPNIIQSLIPKREELPSGAPYGSRRLLSEELGSFGGAPGLTKEQTDINNFGRAYLEASPEEKAQMRAAANEIVTNGTKFVEEMLPEINRFLEATVNLRKGVPRLNEVKSAKDVAALFSFYATQGLAQIAPLVIAGAATKSKGAVVSLAGTMNLGGSVTQRFNYLMNAFKSIENTDEKAEALITYLEKTGDDTLKQAILNSGLDSFFGVVGASTRAKYAKELGKGTVKQQAKEVGKQVGSEAVTEGTQEFIDAATAVKLRETTNALFSKKTFADVIEAALAGGLGAGTFKAVEIPTGIGLRKTVETYKDSRVKAVLDGIFDRLTPKEKEFVNAQNEAGTSPSETLDLLQITFGQKKDPARVVDPDGNEIADAIGSEKAKDITEFVNANNKITEEVENGNYTEQEADIIADKVFTLIEQESMTGDAAFAQAKKELDDARGDGEQESSGLYDTQIYDEEGKPVLTQEQDKKEVEDSRLETPSDGRVPEVNNIRYEEDIPDEKWLNSKKKIDEKLGRDEYGRLKNLNSSITGQFKDVTGGNSKTAILELPVTLLQDLPGWANEHIRLQDVEQHTSSDTKTFADMRNDWDTVKRYPIDIRVDSDGNARVYEGNHRLILAKELGQTSVPVLVTYHAVNPKKAQEGFTPEELLFTHKKYNKEKQAQAKTQTEEQDQTSPTVYTPPDLTEYGDAAPAIEAANLEANKISDGEQSAQDQAQYEAQDQVEDQAQEASLDDAKSMVDEIFGDDPADPADPAGPADPISTTFDRMQVLPNIVADIRNERRLRRNLFSAAENIPNFLKNATPILAGLPTDDLRRLFHLKTRKQLDFKGVDEDHLFNISETVRQITREQGETIKRYAPLVQAWSDFIKKSNVTAKEYRSGRRSKSVQLSRVMNLSRRLKIDPSKQSYEELISQTPNRTTGEVLTDRQLVVLYQELNSAIRNAGISTTTIKAINKDIAARQEDIKVLYAQWEDLTGSKNGQQAADIYTGVLNAYREMLDGYEQVLIDNIESLGVSKKQTNSIVQDIRDSFAARRENEPAYVQAVRNGDYYVRIPKTLTLKGRQDKVPGTRGTVFLNSSGEVDDFKRRIAETYDVDLTNSKEIRSGKVANYISDIKEEDPGGLIQRIFNAIDEAAPQGKDELKKMVGQIWLQTLPSSNVKVLFGSRREGTFGESDDILSGFADTIKSVANQFPRIRYANRMRNEISAARDQITGFPEQDGLENILNEVEKRINLELTPPGGLGHAVARGLNKATFLFLLTAPKTALVQLTQYPLVMAPVLNEYFGESVGYFAVKRTVLRYLALPNTLGVGRLQNLDQNNPGRMEWPSIVLSNYIQGTGIGSFHRLILTEAGAWSPNAQEQADDAQAFMKWLWTEADKSGILRQTYAADLTGSSDLPSVYQEGVKAGLNRGAAFAFDLMTGLFSNAERLNREFSLMSAGELAYREAKKQGLVGDARWSSALARAFEATREGALDFTPHNKPRALKETPYGVSGLQFTSYQLMMQSKLARSIYRAVALMDKRYTWKDRLAAIETIITIQLGTAIMAGMDKMYGGTALALFIVGGISALLSALHGDMDDEYAENKVKTRAKLKILKDKNNLYENWLKLPDSLRERVKIPPSLTSAERQFQTNFDAMETSKLWREVMAKHPRYKGFLNLKSYLRDIVLPNYIGEGGKYSEYFDLSEDTQETMQKIAKDGLPAYYGFDISRNTALSNLIVSDMPPDPDPGIWDMTMYTLQGLNIAPGLTFLDKGKNAREAIVEKDWRKFFKTMPRAVSPAIEQFYLNTDGAENYQGFPMKDFGPDYFTMGKTVLGAAGFADKDISDLKNGIYNDSKFVQIVKNDRQKIIDDWKKWKEDVQIDSIRRGKKDSSNYGIEFSNRFDAIMARKDEFNETYSKLIDGAKITIVTLAAIRDNTLADVTIKHLTNGLLAGNDSAANKILKLYRLRDSLKLFPSKMTKEKAEKRFSEIETKLQEEYKAEILEAREEILEAREEAEKLIKKMDEIELNP